MSRGRDGNYGYVVTDETLEVDLHTPPKPATDAFTVLRSVLSRDGAERSATETLREELAASESLATLVPRYLDALGRAVSRLGVEAAVRAGLRDAGGLDLEQRAADSPGWGRLLLACAGNDARATVAEAVRTRLLDPTHAIEDMAAVLTWRVNDLVVQPEAAAQRCLMRPPWVPPPPAGLAADAIGAWAMEQDRLIGSRVSALVNQVATTPLGWANGIPPRPQEPAARTRWDADVATVAAYRDQHRIPDDVDLVNAGGRGQVRGPLAVAVAAQRRLHAPPVAAAPAQSLNQRLQALAEAARQRPDRTPVPATQRQGPRRPEPPRPAPRHHSGPTW